jgi:hypothetical protein
VIRVLAAFLLAGCVTPISAVHPRQKYSPNVAYIYGRFALDIKKARSAFGTEKMVFEIRCRDGHMYEVVFHPTQTLQVIALRPSICQIEDVVNDENGPEGSGAGVAFVAGGLAGALVYTAIKGDQTEARQMSSFRLLQNEELEPGGVYYVGDFLAKAVEDNEEQRNVWTLQASDNYEATTEAIKRKYPGFASAETENRISR